MLNRRDALAAGSGLLTGCAHSMAGRSFRLSFGSCARQDLPQPIWSAILREQADLHLFGGDNVYASRDKDWHVDILKAAYRKALQIPDHARMLTERRHVEVWDDHDYGSNDGGVEWPHKQEAKDLFLAYFGIPADDPRRARDGLYMSWVYGSEGRRVQLILLDGRWFRSPWRVSRQLGAPGRQRYEPDEDERKTILGATQWAWLEQRLREPAELRIVYSSYQVLALGHGYERWGLLPHERARLLALLDASACPCLLLSGDRHLGALYEEREGLRRPILELTSSSLTHTYAHGAREIDPKSIGRPIAVNHYGMVEVLWDRGRVDLSLRDTDGRAVLQHSLSLPT